MSYFLVVIASLFITLKAGTLTAINTCPLQATDCVGTAANPICCTLTNTAKYENGCYAHCNNPNTPDLTYMCGVCCVGDGTQSAVCTDGVGVCSAYSLDINGYCSCDAQCTLHSPCLTDASEYGECVPPVSAFSCNSCQSCTSIYSSYLTCTTARDCDNLGVGFECLPASLLPSSHCNFNVCKKCSEVPNGCNPMTTADDGCPNAEQICDDTGGGVCGTCVSAPTTTVPITTDPCAAQCVADRECTLTGGTVLGECTAATFAGKCNECEACHVKYTEVGVSVGCLPDAGDCAANEICEPNVIGVCGTCQVDPTLTTTAPCSDACVYDASTDNACYDDATAAYGECTPVANSCNICQLCSRQHTDGCSIVETAECGSTQTCFTANQLTACGTCCSADCVADPSAVCQTADGADGACMQTAGGCHWICEPIIATTTDAAVDPCVNVCADPCYYDNHGVDTPGQCADDLTLQCPVCTACGEIYGSPDFEVCTDANPDVCGADRECVSAGIDLDGNSLYCKICVDITGCVDECAANTFCTDGSGLITGKCMTANSGCLACVPCEEFGKCNEADAGSACLVGAGLHGVCVRDAGKCGLCECECDPDGVHPGCGTGQFCQADSGVCGTCQAHPTTTDVIVSSTAANCDTCSLGAYCASGECVEDTTTTCKTCVACDSIPSACVDFQCANGEVCDRTAAATNVGGCGRCTVVADQSTTDTPADGTETSTSGGCECETAADCADALGAAHYYCTDCVCCSAGCGHSEEGDPCSSNSDGVGTCEWDLDGVCFECVADTTTTQSVMGGNANQMGIMVGMVFVSAIVFV